MFVICLMGFIYKWNNMTEWLHFHFSLSCIEKEMATHSSILAWRIPGTGEAGGLPSMGLHRVRHDWSDLAAAAAATYYHVIKMFIASDHTFPFHFHALEKEMATHSSVLAWRIPGTGEAGGLPSMGLHRVGHDWSDLAVYFNRIKILMLFILITAIWSYFKFYVWKESLSSPSPEVFIVEWMATV